MPKDPNLRLPLTYTRTIRHLYSQLPMFQRIGAAAYKKDLTNTLALCEMLGNPHTKFKTIHVAGTNGKGSVSHLIAAMLQSSGYKTGLYISPHYKDFRERIKINGKYITKTAVMQFVEKYHTRYMKIKPSFFEITVAMAFDFFARQKVDIAVIETGLGGRLDSTNVIMPILSVITNIGYDHMQFLGNTLPAIATEKAGIIKQGVPVVIGETDAETAPVFINTAEERNCPIVFADRHVRLALKSKDVNTLKRMTFDIYEDEKLIKENATTDLYGNFQLKNIATAWQAKKILQQQGIRIDDMKALVAIQKTKLLTNMMGRWDIMRRDDGPLVIYDSAHNEHGLKVSLPELNELNYENLHMIIGFVKDKDLGKALPLFPKNATYYFCKPDIPRGLDARDLQQRAAPYGLKGEVYPSVRHAYFNGALKKAKKEDVIFAGGSTFVVAELLF